MSFRDSKIKVLAGTAHNELALEIAAALDVPLTSASIGRFPDGEIDIKLHEDMRGLKSAPNALLVRLHICEEVLN